MFKYNEPITPGMKLYYNGSDKKWCNRKTGKVTEVMHRGRYVVKRVTDSRVYIMPDRKNAASEHQIPLSEIEDKIQVVELNDLTTSMGMLLINVFSKPEWVLADENFEKTIKTAKILNKGGR